MTLENIEARLSNLEADPIHADPYVHLFDLKELIADLREYREQLKIALDQHAELWGERNGWRVRAEMAEAELRKLQEIREAEMGTAQSTIAGLQDALAEATSWQARAELAEAENVRLLGLLSAIYKDAQRSSMEMWWVPPDVQEAICKIFHPLE